MNNWTIHVTDFGKIEKADIEVAPLTLFVGDNNSGKSYMMTLLYGLFNLRFYFDKYDMVQDSDEYKACEKVIGKMLTLDEENEPVFMDYSLNGYEIGVFETYLNKVLDSNRSRFLLELFNKEMNIGDLKIEFPRTDEYVLSLEEVEDSDSDQVMIIIGGVDQNGDMMHSYGMPFDNIKDWTYQKFFVSYILEYMIKKDFVDIVSDKTVYFPTARTGFLLTYKSLVGSAMQDKFNLNETEKNLLTRPNSDFLTMLSSMSVERQNIIYDDVIAFMEQNVITGHVTVSDLPSHDIMYTPNGEEKQIPMFLTSGVVTEMTPLLLFLRYVELGMALIEEPEISLHPQLQWQMARVLIRLENEGVPVFATTHSDIILQHLNNMIKLDTMIQSGRGKILDGYEEADLIKRQDTAVYQFDVIHNQKTRVTKLSCGEYGYEAMTFYNTLKELNNEIEAIEQMEE